MRKTLFKGLLFLFSCTAIFSQQSGIVQEVLPENVLAFPFGSEDYKSKIYMGLESSRIWSQEKIASWAQSNGFSVTQDAPDGGYQYQRGIIFHSPGLGFVLSAPVTMRGERQSRGWKLALDFGFLFSSPDEEVLSSDFKYYQNILRFEIWIDKIYFQTIEIGYGVTRSLPVEIEIPYIHDESGKLNIELRMKNHPANFGILYDAFLTL
ncbi:MAG: hypothetical protein OEV66_00910 [Spirochaetia bacterium]|nr:hypothetical protein [Spirochaetia bacterium]